MNIILAFIKFIFQQSTIKIFECVYGFFLNYEYFKRTIKYNIFKLLTVEYTNSSNLPGL